MCVCVCVLKDFETEDVFMMIEMKNKWNVFIKMDIRTVFD